MSAGKGDCESLSRGPTGVFGRILVEVHQHDRVDDQAPAKPDEHGDAEQDVHQHGRLEQWQQRPLVVIVRHVPRGPRSPEILPQSHYLGPPSILQLRRCITTPPAIRPIGHDKRAHLRHGPGYT